MNYKLVIISLLGVIAGMLFATPRYFLIDVMVIGTVGGMIAAAVAYFFTKDSQTPTPF
jgi:uncharacterized membrane protein YeaQ/YmgE (transglycosylase-associated protein family)